MGGGGGKQTAAGGEAGTQTGHQYLRDCPTSAISCACHWTTFDYAGLSLSQRLLCWHALSIEGLEVSIVGCRGVSQYNALKSMTPTLEELPLPPAELCYTGVAPACDKLEQESDSDLD